MEMIIPKLHVACLVVRVIKHFVMPDTLNDLPFLLPFYY